jgi:uncharacterized protein YceK
MKKIILVIIICLLGGCASNYQTLRNEKGDSIRCTSSGYGLMGSVIANKHFNDCVENAKQRGYK